MIKRKISIIFLFSQLVLTLVIQAKGQNNLFFKCIDSAIINYKYIVNDGHNYNLPKISSFVIKTIYVTNNETSLVFICESNYNNINNFKNPHFALYNNTLLIFDTNSLSFFPTSLEINSTIIDSLISKESVYLRKSFINHPEVNRYIPVHLVIRKQWDGSCLMTSRIYFSYSDMPANLRPYDGFIFTEDYFIAPEESILSFIPENSDVFKNGYLNYKDKYFEQKIKIKRKCCK